MTKGSPVIPALRYADAATAIAFLCDVLGFERRLVVDGPNGSILHAELTIGAGGMVMLGSADPAGTDKYMRLPGEASGVTMTCYVTVPEIDAHYARAVAGGAAILRPIEDQEYGGRDYTCRDPEGNIWTFGSYDPWTEPA